MHFYPTFFAFSQHRQIKHQSPPPMWGTGYPCMLKSVKVTLPVCYFLPIKSGLRIHNVLLTIVHIGPKDEP